MTKIKETKDGKNIHAVYQLTEEEKAEALKRKEEMEKMK